MLVLYCIVLYCIVWYCMVLYGIVLYCIVLYCIVLYCIVQRLDSTIVTDVEKHWFQCYAVSIRRAATSLCYLNP